MIRVVLFDVDGVLAGHIPFSKRLADDFDITPDITAPFFKGPFKECLLGKADLKHELSSYLPIWNWQDSLDDFLTYWFTSEHHINEPVVLVAQQLRQHGITCYLATNQERYRTAYILQEMGFASCFDGTFSSAYIGYMKPQAEFFDHILHTLGDMDAREILFWDDTLENIVTARDLDLHAELYSSFDDFMEKMRAYFDGFVF